MIELTDEQADFLKQGYAVGVFVPELGEDVVVILAAQQESTESVLQETLDEIRHRAALRITARSSFSIDSLVAPLPEDQRPTGDHQESPTSSASSFQNSSLAPDGAQAPSEADRIALANRASIPMFPRACGATAGRRGVSGDGRTRPGQDPTKAETPIQRKAAKLSMASAERMALIDRWQESFRITTLRSPGHFRTPMIHETI